MGGIKEPVLPFSEYGITVIPTRWMRLMMAPLTATLFWSNRSHSVWLAWVPHHTSHNPPFPVKVVTTNSPKTQRVNIKDLRIPPLRILFSLSPTIEFFSLRLQASGKRTAITSKIICRIIPPSPHFSCSPPKKDNSDIYLPTDIQIATGLKTQPDTRYFSTATIS